MFNLLWMFLIGMGGNRSVGMEWRDGALELKKKKVKCDV